SSICLLWGLMESGFGVVALFSLFCVALCLVRSWHFMVLLGLIEFAWVLLISLYGLCLIVTLDVSFLFWGTMLFVFSAVEVVLGLVGFLLYHTHNRDGDRGRFNAFFCLC